ncbi:MAG: site-2 protease family protein, partial [bacterium]
MTEQIHPHAGDTLTIVWEREGELFSASVVPQGAEFSQGGKTISFGRIGINPRAEFRKVGIFKSAVNSVAFTGVIIVESLKMVKQLVTGKASLNEVAGPVGIAQLSGQTIRSSLISFIELIAQISISVGLLNILPFPVLDGGHVVYIGIEAIIRRPISTRVKL